MVPSFFLLLGEEDDEAGAPVVTSVPNFFPVLIGGDYRAKLFGLQNFTPPPLYSLVGFVPPQVVHDQ